MTALNWIKVDASIYDNPKTRRLARMLHITPEQTVGHLVRLWSWALRIAPTGLLSNADAIDVAEAARYEGDPEEFLTALMTCSSTGVGFLIKDDSDRLRIHDWEDYSGALEARREKDRRRKRFSTDATRKNTDGAGNARKSMTRQEEIIEEEKIEEETKEEDTRQEESISLVPSARQLTRDAQDKTISQGTDIWTQAQLNKIREVIESPKPNNLDVVLAQWRETYGSETVERCIAESLLWLRENDRHYHNMGRYIGNWLRNDAARNGTSQPSVDYGDAPPDWTELLSPRAEGGNDNEG